MSQTPPNMGIGARRKRLRLRTPLAWLLGTFVIVAMLLGGAVSSSAMNPTPALTGNALTGNAAPTASELVLYWGDGCPNCAAEKKWLAKVAVDQPDLVITQYEV